MASKMCQIMSKKVRLLSGRMIHAPTQFLTISALGNSLFYRFFGVFSTF